MKIILHFTNCDKFATEVPDDEVDVFYTEWDTHDKEAFETVSDAWILHRDVLWVEFPENKE